MRKHRSPLDSFRPQRSVMTIRHRFAPISGRFEPERAAGILGIRTLLEQVVNNIVING